ncbi:hypothetical protein NCS55_00329000 [Fusarium keratoplasticum]|nr:hypothetical protein NCS55_00329000 [Fusarium keratoplasticum]
MKVQTEKKIETPEGLTTVSPKNGEIVDDPTLIQDAVFGEITEDGPNYRNVGWIGTSATMMKCQIGLGVLSIPAAFDVLGMIPGVICMMVIAALSTWGSYVIGGFKLNHREIYGIDNAAGIMFGRVGREIVGFCFILSGMPGMRRENPGLATLLSSFTFPTGFAILTIVNTELFTANLFVVVFTTFMRKTRGLDLARNLITSYIFNLAGALFVAGFLCWWSDTLSTDAAKSYAVAQAEARVNVQWSVNLLRGVGCNWFVGLAMFLSIAAHDQVSKIYAIWIPIWTFVALGYQHSIANFFLVPIGMFYGTNFGVGKFIYQSVIPVTLGNIIGGAGLNGILLWIIYGRRRILAENGGTKRANSVHGVLPS